MVSVRHVPRRRKSVNALYTPIKFGRGKPRFTGLLGGKEAIEEDDEKSRREALQVLRERKQRTREAMR